MKTNNLILGVLIGAGIVVGVLLYHGCNSSNASSIQLQNAVNEVLKPFEENIFNQFQDQNTKIEILDVQQKEIIEKTNEIIEKINIITDTLNSVNYKTDYLIYGNNRIFKAITNNDLNTINN